MQDAASLLALLQMRSVVEQASDRRGAAASCPMCGTSWTRIAEDRPRVGAVQTANVRFDVISPRKPRGRVRPTSVMPLRARLSRSIRSRLHPRAALQTMQFELRLAPSAAPREPGGDRGSELVTENVTCDIANASTRPPPVTATAPAREAALDACRPKRRIGHVTSVGTRLALHGRRRAPFMP